MSFQLLLATVEEKRAARAEAKARYDAAVAAERTHCTENYDHFARQVREAFAQYQAAQDQYHAALTAVVDHAANEMQAAYSEFEPAFNIHGDQSIYHEGTSTPE